MVLYSALSVLHRSFGVFSFCSSFVGETAGGTRNAFARCSTKFVAILCHTHLQIRRAIMKKPGDICACASASGCCTISSPDPPVVLRRMLDENERRTDRFSVDPDWLFQIQCGATGSQECKKRWRTLTAKSTSSRRVPVLQQ